MPKDDEGEEEINQSDLPDESDVKPADESGGNYPCPYCGKEVSEDELRCPHCQRYVSKEDTGSHPWRWIVILVLLVTAGIIAWISWK